MNAEIADEEAKLTVELIDPNDRADPRNELAGFSPDTEAESFDPETWAEDASEPNSVRIPSLDEGEVRDALEELGIEIDRSTDMRRAADAVSAHLATIYREEMHGALCPIADATVGSIISTLYLQACNRPVSLNVFDWKNSSVENEEQDAEEDYDFSFPPNTTRLDLERLPSIVSLAPVEAEAHRKTKIDRETKLDR